MVPINQQSEDKSIVTGDQAGTKKNFFSNIGDKLQNFGNTLNSMLHPTAQVNTSSNVQVDNSTLMKLGLLILGILVAAKFLFGKKSKRR